MKKFFLLLLICAFVALPLVANAQIKPGGQLRGDMATFLYDVQDRLLNRCFNSGALANATNDVQIAAAINYTKNGVFGQIATGYIDLTGGTQAISTTKLYAFTYNTTTATTEVVVGPVGVTDINLVVPTTSNILFGYVKIVTPSTHTFVPNSTALGTNNTVTYYNVGARAPRITVSTSN